MLKKQLGFGVLWVLSMVTGLALLGSCVPSSPTMTEAPSPMPTVTPTLTLTPTPTPVQKQRSSDLSHLRRKHPAEVDNSALPVTSVEELHTTGRPPHEVDLEEYRLVIDGLVENPLTLEYRALLEYPTVTDVVLLICPGFFVDNAEWTGVPMASLLKDAGVKPEAEQVTFHSMDGYKQTFPLEVAAQEGVFLAHQVNGDVLPLVHGFPIRLVAKGRYGHDWVKWITRIELR